MAGRDEHQGRESLPMSRVSLSRRCSTPPIRPLTILLFSLACLRTVASGEAIQEEPRDVVFEDPACPAFLVEGELHVTGNLIANGRVLILTDADLTTFENILIEKSAADPPIPGPVTRAVSESGTSIINTVLKREKISRFAHERCKRRAQSVEGDLTIPAADLVIGGGKLIVGGTLFVAEPLTVDSGASVDLGRKFASNRLINASKQTHAKTHTNTHIKVQTGKDHMAKETGKEAQGNNADGFIPAVALLSRSVVYVTNAGRVRSYGKVEAQVVALDKGARWTAFAGDWKVQSLALLGASNLAVTLPPPSATAMGLLEVNEASVAEASELSVAGAEMKVSQGMQISTAAHVKIAARFVTELLSLLDAAKLTATHNVVARAGIAITDGSTLISNLPDENEENAHEGLPHSFPYDLETDRDGGEAVFASELFVAKGGRLKAQGCLRIANDVLLERMGRLETRATVRVGGSLSLASGARLTCQNASVAANLLASQTAILKSHGTLAVGGALWIRDGGRVESQLLKLSTPQENRPRLGDERLKGKDEASVDLPKVIVEGGELTASLCLSLLPPLTSVAISSKNLYINSTNFDQSRPKFDGTPPSPDLFVVDGGSVNIPAACNRSEVFDPSLLPIPPDLLAKRGAHVRILEHAFSLVLLESGSKIQVGGGACQIERLDLRDRSEAKVDDCAVASADVAGVSRAQFTAVRALTNLRLVSGSSLTYLSATHTHTHTHILPRVLVQSAASLEVAVGPTVKSGGKVSCAEDLVAQDHSRIEIAPPLLIDSGCQIVSETFSNITLGVVSTGMNLHKSPTAALQSSEQDLTGFVKPFYLSVPPTNANALQAFTRSLPIQESEPYRNELWSITRGDLSINSHETFAGMSPMTQSEPQTVSDAVSDTVSDTVSHIVSHTVPQNGPSIGPQSTSPPNTAEPKKGSDSLVAMQKEGLQKQGYGPQNFRPQNFGPQNDGSENHGDEVANNVVSKLAAAKPTGSRIWSASEIPRPRWDSLVSGALVASSPASPQVLPKVGGQEGGEKQGETDQEVKRRRRSRFFHR